MKTNPWDALAALPGLTRLLIKLLIFVIVALLIFFPNPVKFWQQLPVYFDAERLVETDFPAMKTINAKIDSLLTAESSREDEAVAVQNFVFRNIQYRYDWDLWLNSDYWPKASIVWEKGFEDCDGRAVLAASILRARGFEKVKLVASPRHIWVRVDTLDLMGADGDGVISYEDGKKEFQIPSWKIIMISAAYNIYAYPTMRIAALIVVAILLSLHPIKSSGPYFTAMVLALLSFLFLHDWAQYVTFYDEPQIRFCLIASILLFFATIGIILRAYRQHRKK